MEQVVRLDVKTPGGWGAENYRSLCRTGPSEATIIRCWSKVAGEGLKEGKTKVFGEGLDHCTCCRIRHFKALPALPRAVNKAIMTFR